MTTALVTGATGFIGSTLVERLKALGYQVAGTTTSEPAPGQFQCNLGTGEGIEDTILSVRPDVIFHCAAISSVVHGADIDYYAVNVVGTKNILAAMKKLGTRPKLIFLSTAGVYGNHNTDVLHEELPALPVHDYGMSKFSAERWIYNYSDHIEYTIVRPFNIIGPRQNSSFLVPKVTQAFSRGDRQITLGNIDVYRDYIDVDTCVDILIQIYNSPKALGQTINLCSGRSVSLRELIEALQFLAGYEIEIIQAPEFIRKNEVWRLLGSKQKLEAILGNAIPLKPLQDTLRSMIDHYRSTL